MGYSTATNGTANNLNIDLDLVLSALMVLLTAMAIVMMTLSTGRN